MCWQTQVLLSCADLGTGFLLQHGLGHLTHLPQLQELGQPNTQALSNSQLKIHSTSLEYISLIQGEVRNSFSRNLRIYSFQLLPSTSSMHWSAQLSSAHFWWLNSETSEQQPRYQPWVLTGISKALHLLLPPHKGLPAGCVTPCLFGSGFRQAIGQESLWGIGYPAWTILLSDTCLAFISHPLHLLHTSLVSPPSDLNIVLQIFIVDYVPFLSQSPSTPWGDFPN